MLYAFVSWGYLFSQPIDFRQIETNKLIYIFKTLNTCCFLNLSLSEKSPFKTRTKFGKIKYVPLINSRLSSFLLLKWLPVASSNLKVHELYFLWIMMSCFKIVFNFGKSGKVDLPRACGNALALKWAIWQITTKISSFLNLISDRVHYLKQKADF